MRITLNVWRQTGPTALGRFERYAAKDVSPHMSFLEMLDVVNEELIEAGKDPIAFEHDCREGICGSCGMVINGVPHGPKPAITVCQLHMRHYKDGDRLVIEPWRAAGFPVIKDLIVDRSAFDRIIASGGYVSVNTGGTPDANSIPIEKFKSDEAFDYAACIGCGACVAACPNASASLFTAAKMAHLSSLPQGHPERSLRARRMVDQMQDEGFGDCSNHAECEAVCPKGISIKSIATMRVEYLRSLRSG